MSNVRPDPAFLLGIDGLPYTLARRLIEDGTMPNLGVLCQTGTLAQMHTTVPDFSCVAWTSFATGVNPGKHGIYGFTDFHPQTGENYFPTVKDCRAPALWHEVGKAGGRSLILNLPGTYPALPLRGKMVSGFIATDFDKSCYPASFGQTLKTLGYRMDLDGQFGLCYPDKIKDILFPVFEARKTAIRHAIQNEYWDLCIAVITETDRLQHFFQHTLYDPNHPLHAWTRSFYVALDNFIGEVADLLKGKADLFMVSDHGFEVIRHQVTLEPLLQELGLSVLGEKPAWENPDTAAKTKVFTLDPGRFYINRKNSRFSQGCVEESEVPDILARLTDKLASLTDPATGEKIVNTIRLKENGFWGDARDHAPDLIAATKPGYYFRSFVFPTGSHIIDMKWEANHVWSDAIVYTPFPIKPDYQPMIWDVLPTALTHMGITLPTHLDGQDLHIS
jgi:predicted AlkP superfamily phosphohydrolase/phosphomutase